MANCNPQLTTATAFQQLRVPGVQTRQAVDKLVKELTWHKDLRTAAKAASETGKPILWIQALGDLKGYT